MFEAVHSTTLEVGEGGLGEGMGLGVGVEATRSAARLAARFSSFVAFRRARFSSGESALRGGGEGVGRGFAGCSIRVEGVGRGLGGVREGSAGFSIRVEGVGRGLGGDVYES